MLDVTVVKEQEILDTPLLLFDCAFGGDRVEHWSTHSVIVGGITYDARVLKQTVFETQFGSDLGVDSIPRISLELGNADSYFSELERSIGVKGGLLTVSFVFYSFASAAPSSNVQVLFKGILDPPSTITEDAFRISASNRLSLQRVVLPDIRLQKRCPWEFPTSAQERQEGVSGGDAGKYSRFYRCGYSPDFPGGTGNLSPDGTPFTSCAYTRSDCIARGMFNADILSNRTARFGGIEFVPSTIVVRSAGEKGTHLSAVDDNEARYNDFVPLVYGTAWFSPSIVFSRNDGNLTHFELILGAGEIMDVQKVLVNSIEIPVAQNGQNMTGTGWYSVVSSGQRDGTFNNDFLDNNGIPLGDPYGSMAFMSLVVPNRINDGTSLPSVQVLLDGMLVNQYDSTGNNLGTTFSNNPAWIILDLLLRIGWDLGEIDLPYVASTAAYCQEQIQANDLFGNPVMIPRFGTNLVLKSRRAAADVMRGIKNANRLFLRYGSNGLLQVAVENSISLQQAALSPSSNANESLNGGWPAYEFGDGTSNTTGIARTATGSSSVQLSSRATADTPNRFVAEFQDAFNEYQQDSLSIVDADDVATTGQEITGTTPVLGIPHFDQAARILQFFLDKSVHGNTVIEFQTSIRALGLTPGDIVAVTYLKEGLERQPFRVVKIQPGTNYRTVKLTCQWHDDTWYSDTNGQTSADASRRQGESNIGLPRPLAGVIPDSNGNLQFAVVENVTQSPDGFAVVTATISFGAPKARQTGGPDIPLLSLSPVVASLSGTLPGGNNQYYAITSLNAGGVESSLSFAVYASLPQGSSDYSVMLTGLSFPPAAVAFQVYRGTNPSNLSLIAGSQPLASSFTDPGLALSSVLPPDSNYDHADFYWRLELQPPTAATTFSPLTIGSSLLEMIPGSYVGMVARIVAGTGQGQESLIVSNSVTLLTLSAGWPVTPDSTSSFVIAQGSYQFGATTRSSPVQFTIPNQAGNVIEISGRSANCNGIESPYELSPLTRWTIGGAGIVNVDTAPPATPLFGMSVSDSIGGTVVFGALAFPDLSNLSTVTAGTYTLNYLNELNPSSLFSLSASIGVDDTQLFLSNALGTSIPQYILLDSEMIAITVVNDNGLGLTVSRSVLGSVAASHQSGCSAFAVQQSAFVVSFPKQFFGSPASGDWSYPVSLPNARILSAALYVTNSQGNSPEGMISFSSLVDGGLRTLSGGQFSFEVNGFLAVQAGASPDIIVDGPKVVRDIYAVVKQSPVGSSVQLTIRLNGSPYCSLTISDGESTVTAAVDGVSLSPMQYQDRLSLDIDQVGLDLPGSDLTVIIRV